MQKVNLDLTIDGVDVSLAVLRRDGVKRPLVCLHGFGSSKEDYADLALLSAFDDRALVLIDAPGCGASPVSAPERVDIPFLVRTTVAALDALELGQVHLLGHSLGGLTALLIARDQPQRAASFFDIEGNVAPEDCFLSRQILQHPAATPDAFLEGLRARVIEMPAYGTPVYAAGLTARVTPAVVAPIFRSMVAISDSEPLLADMAALPIPRAFVYGAQNRHLSYLPRLAGLGIEPVEIPHSAHFPMYSNPPALWAALAAFLARAEAAE